MAIPIPTTTVPAHADPMKTNIVPATSTSDIAKPVAATTTFSEPVHGLGCRRVAASAGGRIKRRKAFTVGGVQGDKATVPNIAGSHLTGME